jgi:hypothetical protein
MIKRNLVSWHSRIIGTASDLSKSCLLIRLQTEQKLFQSLKATR